MLWNTHLRQDDRWYACKKAQPLGPLGLMPWCPRSLTSQTTLGDSNSQQVDAAHGPTSPDSHVCQFGSGCQLGTYSCEQLGNYSRQQLSPDLPLDTGKAGSCIIPSPISFEQLTMELWLFYADPVKRWEIRCSAHSLWYSSWNRLILLCEL